jgi:hypothetical protein
MPPTTDAKSDTKFSLPPEVEMKRIAPLEEASYLSSLSVDTLKRKHADKIITLSPRRLGMRVGDALMLATTRG